MNHEATIRNYYAAWVRDDLDGVFALCAEDVVAVNVPIGPIHGKPAVRAFIEKFNRGISGKRYDVERILVSGDVAMVEGVESYVKKGKTISLPYMSLFLFEGPLIREWRDYFDLDTVLRQLDLPPQRSGAASGRAPAASAS